MTAIDQDDLITLAVIMAEHPRATDRDLADVLGWSITTVRSRKARPDVVLAVAAVKAYQIRQRSQVHAMLEAMQQ